MIGMVRNAHYVFLSRGAEKVAEATELNEGTFEWIALDDVPELISKGRHTAVTRENAHRAGTELRARGVVPDSPADRVTGQEWLEAHHEEQTEAERYREIHDEYELHDPTRELAQVDGRGLVVEAVAPDVRAVTAPDPTERSDPAQRHRVPTVDETAEAVSRAQASLAEVAAREVADRARETEENARRDELTRWSHEADAAAAATADDGEALDW
jgi:hypothetical protein